MHAGAGGGDDTAVKSLFFLHAKWRFLEACRVCSCNVMTSVQHCTQARIFRHLSTLLVLVSETSTCARIYMHIYMYILTFTIAIVCICIRIRMYACINEFPSRSTRSSKFLFRNCTRFTKSLHSKQRDHVSPSICNTRRRMGSLLAS